MAFPLPGLWQRSLEAAKKTVGYGRAEQRKTHMEVGKCKTDPAVYIILAVDMA